MKILLHRTLFLFSLLAVLVSSISSTETALALQNNASTSASFTYAQLGATDLVLQGPYDSRQIRFSLPANWALQDGAEMTIYVDASFAGSASGTTKPEDYLGGMLDVYFNGRLQQSIPLRAGQNIAYTVPIQPSALTAQNADGRLNISFFLNAAIDCQFGFHRTTIKVSADSLLFLPYTERAITMDLRRLPWPIYQPDINMPNPALLIVPDNASAEELQAALLVMAGFSRMSQGTLPLDLLPASEATDELLKDANLIFVGKAANVKTSKPVNWPMKPSSTGNFASSEMQPDDGVLQMSASPWNEAKTTLLVSGNTDAAVVKAAQALTTGNLQTSSNPAISFVAEINPIADGGVIRSPSTESGTPLSANNYQLSDLGYTTSTSSGIGTNWFTYEFVIAAGEVPTAPTYIELVFSNSALVDPNRSGMVIYLNNKLVGSARFESDNNSLVTSRINIPASIFRTGRNQIDVAADLIPTDICSVFSFNGLWMTIYEESFLHLPLRPATSSVKTIKDLRNFPTPFINDPSLATTTFILPPASPEMWSIAGKLAYSMGNRATGNVISFNVGLDGTVPPETYRANDLIILGQPSKLPILESLKDAMPASFESGSNVASLKNQQVIYRVADKKDLGYLEIFPSPWDSSNAIILIGGTTQLGVSLASEALIQTKILDTLSGNFATIDGAQTLVVDTRTGAGTGRMATGLGSDVITLETPEVVETAATTNNFEQTREQIFTAILVVGGIMVVIFIVALILSRRRKTMERTTQRRD